MLKRIPLLLFVATFMICNSPNADAFTIKKGTVSLGGSSNLSFGRSDTDKTSSTDDIIASIESGYFFLNNLEVGGVLTIGYINGDDNEIKSYSISPFVTYHFDLNETSNIYLTGMIGYSKSYHDHKDFNDESDGTILSAEIGWEYFFNPSVSGTIGVGYTRRESDLVNNNRDIDSSFTYTSFGTNIGLKIYF